MEKVYTIRVVSVLDRSTAAAVGDAVQQYERATRANERGASRQAQAHERAQKYVAGIRDRYFLDQQRAEERADQRAAQQQRRASERSQKAAEAQAAKETRAQERAQAYVARIKERYFQDEQRREERADAARQQRVSRNLSDVARRSDADRKARLNKIVNDSVGTAAAIGQKAVGVAGEVTSGLGIDVSLQRGVAKGVELEKLAVAITNAGNRGLGGARGEAERARQPQELQSLARGLGEKYAYDPAAVLRGLAQYQALTGDLDTAKAGLEDLTKLSKAFNVDLDKMVAAAGQLGSAVGDVGTDFKTPEDKAKAIYELLKQSTAQGQEGAIEISDQATQYAKLKAAGMRFEGGVGANIGKMSALAQLSYQTGGAGSVREATNAVMGFVNTLGTPARRKQFRAMGVDIENAKGEFLDPYQIIKQSLLKTGGDTDKMNSLFKNVVGYKAISTFATAYRGAGGGQKGLAAVDAQFARFGGTVSEDTIKENLGRAMGTKESKAQTFQTRLDTVASSVGDRLLPALDRLAPNAEKAAVALGDLVAWAGTHPGAAVGAAIAASVAKAAIGPMIGEALRGAISKVPTGGLAVGTAVLTIAAATMSVQKFNEEKEGARTAATKRVEETTELINKAAAQMKAGKVDKGLLDELAQRRAEIFGQQQQAERYDREGGAGVLAKATAGITDYIGATEGASKTIAQNEGAAETAQAMKGALDAQAKGIDSLIAAVRGGTLKVYVTNPGDISAGNNTTAQNGRVGIAD